MVTVKLYNYEGDPTAIQKDLAEVGEIKGYIRERVNVLTPLLKIESINVKFNYVYIVELQKYYFIQNTTIINTKTENLDLRLDVLKTWQSRILNAIATRTNGTGTNYLNTNNAVFNVKTKVTKVDFLDKFDKTDGTIILVTSKGGK